MNKESMIQAGGKVWEKNNSERVYFNTKGVIAKLFNYAEVDHVSGSIPAGFDGMMTNFGAKTRSYYDVKKEMFMADSGDIANAARQSGLKVGRL
jgi:hypothetical protein